MYKILDESGNTYSLYNYEKESQFESMIIENVDSIFGKNGIYFDFKKLIGKQKKGASIPDGYYLDLTFHNEPQLYLVEVELSGHDVYGHIGNQLLRFGTSSDTAKHKIKTLLLEHINSNSDKKKKLIEFVKQSKYDNINELLDKVIYENKPSAIIIIDEATEDLYTMLNQLTMPVDVIEAQTYVCRGKHLYRFTPFNDDVLTDLPVADDADELNTVVVPAREDGFKEEFLKNNCWYAIRISASMIDKIKYVAAYQVSPVSGITHIAEVEHIEKYKDTNKYIVYFKANSVRKVNVVSLGKYKELAPQSPRYTSYSKITEANSIDDLWQKNNDWGT